MNWSESSQPLRDPWQTTFIMFNRFWSLSKNPLPPPSPPFPPPSPPPSSPFLMGNVRLHGMPTTSFEEVLLWKVIRYSYQLFYFLFYISFCINRLYFHNFLEFHSTLSQKKKICPKFSFFNWFTLSAQPHLLDGQNLLNVAKRFLLIFPKMSSEIFFFPKIY